MSEYIRSSVDQIVWPPVPSSSASTVFGMLYGLEQTQWWPAEKLEQYQLKQALELVRHARRNVPYYDSDAYRNIDVSTMHDMHDWRSLPLLDRTQIQAHYDTLKSNSLPRGHGSVESKSTSGSTGTPVTVDWSQLCEFFWHVGVQRDHLWHQRRLSGALASIRHVKFDHIDQSPLPPDGIALDNWGPVVADCFTTGRAHVLSIHCSAEEQADWLAKVKPDYLQTYPSNLQRLLEYYQASDRPRPELRAVRTISEALKPETRTLCESVLNAPVEDLYSTTEVGYIALQCPGHPHYHVQSETMLVEVLNDDNQPCEVGEIGRVVVTPLHNFAMPLIRYEIGDYAEVGEPCECGRGLPVLKRILGRSRNLLTFPDGRTDWPVFNDTKFRQIAPVKQFQFSQSALHNIDMKLVVERRLTETEMDALRVLILDRLGYPFQLDFHFVDAIERSESGKYEDFVSKIRD